MTFRRLHRWVLCFATVFGLALLAATPAKAFTLEDKSAAAGNGSASAADPDRQLTSRYNSGGQTVIRQGNTTLKFGSQREESFDQRYDSGRYFEPNNILGR